MPTFYNYTENGTAYAFDDVFVPADAFRQGNLWVWGGNSYGQVGNNNTTTRICTPVTSFAGGANWKQVSISLRHSAAIKTDGTLWTWGRNYRGSLGTNDTNIRCTPVTTFAGGTNWKQVSGGQGHTAAIKTDGTLWSWGPNFGGNLGNNSFGIAEGRTTPVTTFAGGTNWKQVSAGTWNTAAIKTDGTLWTWGYNYYGELGINRSPGSVCTPVTTFAGGTNWKQVSIHKYNATAIKSDGTLWTWGRNQNGQLGVNDTIDRNTPVTTFAGGNNWKQVFCGYNYTIAAIKTDGTLWMWGANNSLGNNKDYTAQQMSCTPVTTFAGGTDWKQVSVGNNTAAIKTDGTLWIWGYSQNGNLGINQDAVSRFTPVTTFLGGTNWKQVSQHAEGAAAVTYIDDYI